MKQTTDGLEIVYLSPDELKPYENNTRRHSPDDIEAIKDSIDHVGFLDPIAVWGEKNIIVEGHGRLLAAKEIGLDKVPCIRLDHLTDTQRRDYAIRHNRTAELSAWDFGKLEEEIARLEIEGVDLSGLNFDLDPLHGDDWFSREEKDGGKRQEGNEEYNEFLEKFEAKKTTDDCYTPDNIYNAVADWVAQEYKVNKANFVRPFYPGGDYQAENYKPFEIVVDNPPFSILSEILRFYCEKGIRFFLFAPTLTLFSGRGLDVEYIPTGVGVVYENGASVNTSFITNMGKNRVRSAPTLYKVVDAANDENLAAMHKDLPNYSYPDEVITAAIVGRWSKYGVDFSVPGDECVRISELDEQKEQGKAIFGGGFLLSQRAAAERAAAERAAATKWELSEREREIVKSLGK